MATSDRLPSHPTNKDGRATDSCFGLVGARQCGIQMVMLDDGLLLYPHQVEHLWFQQKHVEAVISVTVRSMAEWGIVTLKPSVRL